MEAWLFSGGWEGHEPALCTNRFQSFLDNAGFKTKRFESLAPLARLTADSRPPLIVMCWTMGQLQPEEERGLLEAVKAGSGLAGWHGGLCDAFRSNTDYQFMTGAQFVAHPGGIMDYTVNIGANPDPITAGIRDFVVHSEQYYLHYDPSIEILATTRFDGAEFAGTRGVEMPVVWKRPFGLGRVFCSALGHCAVEFEVAETRILMERGLLWAAHRQEN